MNFIKEIETLTPLAFSLKNAKDLGEKQKCLFSHPRVEKCISEGYLKAFLPKESDLASKIVLFSLVAIDQFKTVFTDIEKKPPKEKMQVLFSSLISIDHFYESIGGIVGYHLKVLQCLAGVNQSKVSEKITFSRATGTNLADESKEIKGAISLGIEELPKMGEIYPIGGLGTRLNLKSKSGEPLPAASLAFCGRTLLEGLLRDVQAREFLYYRLKKKQVTIPIAMMTSHEKRNAFHIRSICEKKGWFGRPKQSFFLFSQLSVPVITKEGRWSMKAPLELNLQPGGHGALWRTAEEKGLFLWFEKHKTEHLVVRQINNPLAGIDYTLLAFVGIGKREKKAFGFASCERHPHAAEGVLVLAEEKNQKRISNIEYTEFKESGIDDRHLSYPANTNILYANRQKLLPVVKKNPLPGLLLNMKSQVATLDQQGNKVEILGGRLESMMQNISDALISKKEESLPTFLTYNERRRTISSTKRCFEERMKILETPEGAFYDLLLNAYELLRKECKATLPPFSTTEKYLEHGPSVLFLYHPALGPLYSMIAQKIRESALSHNSELQLEIADLLFRNVTIEGSLLIKAENCLGHLSQGLLRYSHKTGKACLKNVKVKNRGIDRKQTTSYWKNHLRRHEALNIFLEGHSEFYAENIIFEGDQNIIVPDGQRWIATQDEGGEINYRVEKPDWRWEYREEKNSIWVEGKPFGKLS